MIELDKAEEVEFSVSGTIMKKIFINGNYLWRCHMNPSFSDVTLVVEDKEFPASRLILSMHSTFFEALFNGNFEDGQKKKIPLEEVKAKPFAILLRYMYSGDLTIESHEDKDIIELLCLAHFLGYHVAVHVIPEYIDDLPLENHNVVEYFNAALLFHFEFLHDTLYRHILFNQCKYIETENFMLFNEAALLNILDSESLDIPEADLLQKVRDWLSINKTTKRKVVCHKSFPLICIM